MAAVETRYPLTSITWLYRRLRFRTHRGPFTYFAVSNWSTSSRSIVTFLCSIDGNNPVFAKYFSVNIKPCWMEENLCSTLWKILFCVELNSSTVQDALECLSWVSRVMLSTVCPYLGLKCVKDFRKFFWRKLFNFFNRVLLQRNYQLIVAPVLKTDICPRSNPSRAKLSFLRTSNFQGATSRQIVQRHKHSIVITVHH